MDPRANAAGLALSIAAPSASDWVVTLWKAGGEAKVLRISPGRGTKEDALRTALRSIPWNQTDIVDATVQRDADRRRIIAEDVETEFARLSRMIQRGVA